MSKYIDYDAIDYRHDKLHGKSSEFLDGVIYMAERIENAPSIDIVRCKECTKHNTHRCHMAFDLVATNYDDYRSYGERRENAEG